MQNRTFSFMSFFRGLVIGSIIAGIIVLFTAPQSGAATRQMLQERGYELRNRTMKSIDDARSRVSNIASEKLQHAADIEHSMGDEAERLSHQM